MRGKESVERALHAFKKVKNNTLRVKRLLAFTAGVSLAVLSQDPADLQLRSDKDISPVTSHKPFLRPYPPTVIDPNSRDYCEVSEVSGPVERKTANLPVAPEEITQVTTAPVRTESAPDEIDTLQIRDTDIVTPGKKNLDKFQVLLIPSKYSRANLEDRMRYLIGGLDNAYRGVDVQFSYATFSLAFDIYRINQFTNVNEPTKARYARLIQKIKDGSPVDAGALMINSDILMGSCCDPAVVSGEHSSAIAVAAHEIGHILGLSDGHPNRSYDKALVNNEQLSTSPEGLTPEVKKAYQELAPPISVMGTCNGEPIYTMGDPSDNIMMSSYPEDRVMLSRQGYTFNPVQRAVMNQVIRERIQKRQKP